MPILAFRYGHTPGKWMSVRAGQRPARTLSQTASLTKASKMRRPWQKSQCSKQSNCYNGLRARIKALTNWPAIPARSSSERAASAVLPPLSAISSSV